MKRFLFLAVLMSMFAIGNVSAQVISYSQTKVTKLEKERKPVELRQFAGAEVGSYSKDPYASMALGVYYEVGAMLNKSIFLGGGFGLGHSFNKLNVPNKLSDIDSFGTPKGVEIKVYADAKFYLTKTKLKPYFDLAIGGIGYNGYNYDYYDGELDDSTTERWYNLSNIEKEFLLDIFANPQFGLDYQLGRNVKSVFISAGYFLDIYGMLDGYCKLEGFRVKLGITF